MNPELFRSILTKIEQGEDRIPRRLLQLCDAILAFCHFDINQLELIQHVVVNDDLKIGRQTQIDLIRVDAELILIFQPQQSFLSSIQRRLGKLQLLVIDPSRFDKRFELRHHASLGRHVGFANSNGLLALKQIQIRVAFCGDR